MTETELAAVIRGIAPVVRELVTKAAQEAEIRLAVLESQQKMIGDVRDRLVMVETKAAQPLAPVPDVAAMLMPLQERLTAVEVKIAIPPPVDPVLPELSRRLTVVETKADPPAVDLTAVLERLSKVEQKKTASMEALSPWFERMARAEERLEVLGDVRDRVVTIETKSAQPVTLPLVEQVPVDLSPVLERVAATEARLAVLGDLRDRVVTMETKAAQPAPEPLAVDLEPVLERVSAVELKLEMKAAETTPILTAITELTKEQATLRERIAVAEVRQLVPGPAGERGSDGAQGPKGDPGPAGAAVVDLSTVYSAVKQVVAELPRPKDGADGLPGKDGTDGLGWDDLAVVQESERTFTVKCIRGLQVKELGTLTFPVLIYRGVFVAGKTYERGDMATHGGSLWHANTTTDLKPGEGSKDWTLCAKRGADGKDLRESQPPPPLPVVHVGTKAAARTERVPIDPHIEATRRSEAVKRAAPWEGQGRRD